MYIYVYILLKQNITEILVLIAYVTDEGCVSAQSCKSLNPFKPSGVSQRYQLEQSTSVLRVVGGILHFYSNFNRTFCKQTVRP